MERKITIEERERYQEDYQMRMLKVNRPEGLLRVRGRGVDGRSFYEYDVSGKVSMKALYERGKIRENDLKQFLASFQTAVREAENYLLNVHRILLKPEYIFYEDDRFYFCYYPPADQDLWTEFHLLTEYLVKQADYQDKEAVRMIFLLHKGTMEENYSMDKLVRECMESVEPEEKKKKQEITYDTREHDWITEQEMGSSILRETDNMWTPVRHFLNRHKKQRWGDWDGLHIEEDEL